MKAKIVLVAILLFGLTTLSPAMGHSYEEIYDPESQYGSYIIHKFSFNPSEVLEIRMSAIKALPYANKVIKQMWSVSDLGDPEELVDWRSIAQGLGSLYLAIRLNNLAKEWPGGSYYLEVRFKSRNDEGGKIAFQIWDAAAGLWKKLSGN